MKPKAQATVMSAVDEDYDYEYAMKPPESQDNAMIISGYIFRVKTPSTL
jgi:hypothetical protein